MIRDFVNKPYMITAGTQYPLILLLIHYLIEGDGVFFLLREILLVAALVIIVMNAYVKLTPEKDDEDG